jgi:threonine/homoserine/homoserine lactone efflux protein
MDIGLVGAFWAVSVLFVLTPGADWAYAIAAGLRNASVLPAVGGMLAGHLTATACVAAGAAALVATSPVLLAGLTITGAAYLVWIGLGTVLRPPAPRAAGEQGPVSGMRQALRGFGVSGLNPKVLLLFLALLPQFTDPQGPWPVPGQILALGVVHVATSALVYTLVGVGARTVLSARPAAARTISRVSGVAMMAIGASLLIGQLGP